VYKHFTNVPAGRVIHPAGYLLEIHDLGDPEPSEGKMQFVCDVDCLGFKVVHIVNQRALNRYLFLVFPFLICCRISARNIVLCKHAKCNNYFI